MAFFLPALSSEMMAIWSSIVMRTSGVAAALLMMVSFACVGLGCGWTASDGGQATVDGENLAGNVLAGVAGEQQGCALEIVVIADALQRRAL
ncbi:hypothetical protein D3C72_2252220 [compost metagenome]